MNENINLFHPSKDLLRLLVNDHMESFLQQDLGIEREVLPHLNIHKKNPYAVVISGLRRVGKSTLLAQIARKHYRENDYYYINFEDERLLNFKADHFQDLLEVLVEVFGERKVFFIDEVQNIIGWERLIRRLIDNRYKVYLTGSNASLLRGELGAKLTGRYIPIELFPFSFYEFLQFKAVSIPNLSKLTTTSKSLLKRLLNQYLKAGGIPNAIKYPEIGLHKTLYEDIIYRDVATRYQISEIKALKELALYLISTTGSMLSFNKLKESLKLGSVNTVKDYIEYLGLSWLFFLLNRYAFSVKTQQIANKKIYAIDIGLVRSIGFSFSKNKGRLLENLVFLHLRKRKEAIFYYKTKFDEEVDFYLPSSGQLIQVCQQLKDAKVIVREMSALKHAMDEMSIKQAIIITEDEFDNIEVIDKKIKIIPIYQWLLEGTQLNNRR